MVPSPFAMSPWLELPYEIRNVSPEEDKAIKKCLIGYTKTFVKCGKMGYVMPGAFRKHAEAIYNMRVRPDDIWVITFPRSGTTWTQEMVWLIENDLDYKSAKKQPLFERFPMLETTSQIPEIAFELIKANFMNLGYFQGLNNAVKVPSWKSIDEAPSPRFIKTHLPISLLPPSLLSTAKVIYVARDPRDVAVSYYYLHKMVSKTLMRSTFTHFWDAFRRDLRTTWTQEMVWLIENDLDYKSAKKQPLFERFPMLETTSQIPEIAFELIKANFMNLGYFQGLNNAVKVPSWKSIDEAPSPRFIKTHLPISLLPPSLLSTAKVIYVARDPRDVAVSYYYLHKMVSKTLMRSTFTHFWDAFRRDLLPWTPIIEHTNEAWDLRHAENMHFLFYEDMIKDLPKVIRGVCKFLDRKYSDEQVTKLSEHLSFNNLQKNKTVNNTANENGEIQFIRKGEAGGWRTHFDAKMEFEAEEFLSTKLKGLTLKYPSLCDADGECVYL